MSSSGYHLMDKGGVTCLKRLLLSLATIVTPNLNEAAVLAGMKKVSNPEDMKQAAIKIKGLGPMFVLVKGGHLKEVRSQKSEVRRKAVDILYDGKKFKTFASKMIDKEMHGTGCILSSAIASLLAKGMGVEDAVKKAKAYTTRIIISE
ncbi:MAG: bifunctional hydroxymethylpyrimidine kinase/phosphomethylpyrimidine kinase, partial [Deltaproteobacteria bacterium]